MEKNMDYELVDLIDIKELQKLTDNWTNLIDLPMGMFDPYGNVLLGSGWHSVCTDFHRVIAVTISINRIFNYFAIYIIL